MGKCRFLIKKIIEIDDWCQNWIKRTLYKEVQRLEAYLKLEEKAKKECKTKSEEVMRKRRLGNT